MYGPPYYTDPPDPDDRWELIAERLESEYSTGSKLREIADEQFEELNIVSDLLEMFEGHPNDIDIKAARLIRSLLTTLEKRIEKEVREDADREVEQLDDEAEEMRGEAAYWTREDAA